MRPLACVLAAALLAAAAGGCGDDDEESVSATRPPAAATTERPTTAEDYARPEPSDDQSRWAREVDDACEASQERIDAVPPPSDEADLERWLGEALPLIRKQVAAVEAVQSAPAEAEPFVKSLRAVERGLTRYQRALRRGDAETARQALADAGTAGSRARDAALALGVTECGGYAQAGRR